MRQQRSPRDLPTGRQQQPSRWRFDDSRQRVVIIVVLAAILVAIALPIYGYYRENISSAHAAVSTVGDTEFDLGYLLKLSKSEALVAVQGGVTSAQDIQNIPFLILDQLEGSQVVRAKAPELGVEVTDAEVDAALREFILGPPPTEGEQPSEADFQQARLSYLDAVDMSAADLRKRIEDGVLVEKAQDVVGQQVPEVQEQIHLWAISTQTEEQMFVVLARLRSGEEFIALAKEYNTLAADLDLIGPSLDATSTPATEGDATSTDATSTPPVEDPEANEPGELGWIPKGALTDLGDILFDLPVGEISEPIEGTAIYLVDERDPARAVDETFLSVLRQDHFVDWFQEQRDEVGVERCFEVPFADANSDCSWQYGWLLERLF